MSPRSPSRMLPLGILVAGTPLPATSERRGSFADLVVEHAAGAWPGEWRILNLPAGAELPGPDELAGLVITGSSASLSARAPWMLRGQAYLEGLVAAGTPVLGLCFGHQMLAQALGGSVRPSPGGPEMGSVAVDRLVDDPVLGPRGQLVVNMTHVDSVVRPPVGASIVARSALDPHAALRFRERVWGVQFHPEFDGGIVSDYLTAYRDLLSREGRDAEQLLGCARDTPASAEVIRRFIRVVASGSVA